VLLDGFTVIAQIVNFLVLVVALKFLLYDRITKAIDQRERSIASRLREAEEEKGNAQAEAASHRQQRAEFEQNRQDLLERAREEAEQQRKVLTDEARDDVDALRSAWQQSLAREQRRLLEELQERAGRQVCEISRRALHDLANAELEGRVVAVALARLQDREDELRELLGDGTEDIVVHSAFELPVDARSKVREALRSPLGDAVEGMAFEVDRALVCGLEVRLSGRALGWSIAGYLDALEEEMDDLLPTIHEDEP
jgi:F-type H+-transporting ATPase subunit b